MHSILTEGDGGRTDGGAYKKYKKNVAQCVVLHSLAMWRVCAIVPSFVSGWRTFSSVSLCQFASQGARKRSKKKVAKGRGAHRH
jgi:hypothetical protein